MRIPQVAFLTAGLTEHQRTMRSMGVPVSDRSLPSNSDVEEAWNQRLREVAEVAVPGSVRVGDLIAGEVVFTVMVTYEIEE